MNNHFYLLQNYGVALIMHLVATVISAPTSHDQCGRLMHIDCTLNYVPEPNETVCCSDGKTYDNLCFFAQGKCQDPQLEVVHTGQCTLTTSSTENQTVVTTEKVTGSTDDPRTDIIYSVFCRNRDQIVCDDGLDPVCGSDYTFYHDNCEFAKAKCKDSTLAVQELQNCKKTGRVRRSIFNI